MLETENDLFTVFFLPSTSPFPDSFQKFEDVFQNHKWRSQSGPLIIFCDKSGKGIKFSHLVLFAEINLPIHFPLPHFVWIFMDFLEDRCENGDEQIEQHDVANQEVDG